MHMKATKLSNTRLALSLFAITKRSGRIRSVLDVAHTGQHFGGFSNFKRYDSVQDHRKNYGPVHLSIPRPTLPCLQLVTALDSPSSLQIRGRLLPMPR